MTTTATESNIMMFGIFPSSAARRTTMRLLSFLVLDVVGTFSSFASAEDENTGRHLAIEKPLNSETKYILKKSPPLMRHWPNQQQNDDVQKMKPIEERYYQSIMQQQETTETPDSELDVSVSPSAMPVAALLTTSPPSTAVGEVSRLSDSSITSSPSGSSTSPNASSPEEQATRTKERASPDVLRIEETPRRIQRMPTSQTTFTTLDHDEEETFEMISSDSPSLMPSISPTTETTFLTPSISFSRFLQTFHVENNRIFTIDELRLIQGLYRSYTINFAVPSDILSGRIETSCRVTDQSSFPSRRTVRALRGTMTSYYPTDRSLQLVQTVELQYEMTYTSIHTDVSDFPINFQVFVNNHLERVAAQLRLLALDVTHVDSAVRLIDVPDPTPAPTSSAAFPSHSPPTIPNFSSSLPSDFPSFAPSNGILLLPSPSASSSSTLGPPTITTTPKPSSLATITASVEPATPPTNGNAGSIENTVIVVSIAVAGTILLLGGAARILCYGRDWRWCSLPRTFSSRDQATAVSGNDPKAKAIPSEPNLVRESDAFFENKGIEGGAVDVGLSEDVGVEPEETFVENEVNWVDEFMAYKNSKVEESKRGGNTSGQDTSHCDTKEGTISAIVKGDGWGTTLKNVPEDMKNDRDVVMTAIRSGGPENWLEYASPTLRNDKDLMQYEKEAVILGIKRCRWSLMEAPPRFTTTNNPQFHTILAIHMAGTSLKYVSRDFQDDKEVVMAAIEMGGLGANSIKYASATLKNDRDIVLAAIAKDEDALRYASTSLRGDKDFLSQLVGTMPLLRLASSQLQDDKEFVKQIVNHDGEELRHASDRLKNNNDIVIAAVSQNGDCLQYASLTMRGDRDCVLAAVSNMPASLQFALEGLNQDKECLIAAGLWDEHYKMQQNLSVQDDHPKIVLSTRFSLDEKSTPTATQFTILFKEHPYIQKLQQMFTIYSPNAFDKSTCDPNWTNKDWPCRGTFDSCRKEDPSVKSGVPTGDSCWRYSFRYQLKQAKRSGGFMIQVVELRKPNEIAASHEERISEAYVHSLGQGQEIESEMAVQVGVKVFKVFQPRIIEVDNPDADQLESIVPDVFSTVDIENLVKSIKEWYEQGEGSNMSECKVRARETINYF